MSIETEVDNILDRMGTGLISPVTDLRPWDKKEEEMRARVRPASSFREDVEAHFRSGQGPVYSGLLFNKARGRVQFRPGEVSMWAGYNKERKSTLTGQVQIDLAKQKEKVLCVSLEMHPARTAIRAAQQAYGDEDVSMGYLGDFLDWTNGRWWIFDYMGRLSPRTAIALCRYFRDVHQGTHVFIDSFMKVVESAQEIDSHKNFMNQIISCAMETGLHIHVVHHLRKPDTLSTHFKMPNRYEMKGDSSISDMPDNCFIVARDRPTEQKHAKHEDLDKPDFYLSVDAQRNAPYEGKLGFWFHGPSMQFLESPDEQPMRLHLD